MQVVRGIVVIATLMLAISCSGGVEPAENAETSATTAVPRDVTDPYEWLDPGGS
jgi:hypothetical protein